MFHYATFISKAMLALDALFYKTNLDHDSCIPHDRDSQLATLALIAVQGPLYATTRSSLPIFALENTAILTEK